MANAYLTQFPPEPITVGQCLAFAMVRHVSNSLRRVRHFGSTTDLRSHHVSISRELDKISRHAPPGFAGKSGHPLGNVGLEPGFRLLPVRHDVDASLDLMPKHLMHAL